MAGALESLRAHGRWIRAGLQWAAVPYAAVRRERGAGVVVLLYHRVGAGTFSSIDLAADAFERQMRYLRRHHVVVGMDQLVALAQTRQTHRGQRDVVVVTFDDGYRDTYDVAYPILRRYGIPATVYVPALYLEEQRPFDFGGYRRAHPALRPRPMTWAQAADMVRSGLITIGSHTHSHADCALLSPQEARQEMEKADLLIAERLGVRPRHFAYPWGRWTPAVHAVAAARYATVALGGRGKNPYAALSLSGLWRYPVVRTDRYWFFRVRLATLPAPAAQPPTQTPLTAGAAGEAGGP
jgi:peptidoglycan/xylan/chitin deacetylase (PgdA/CDA1 family)